VIVSYGDRRTAACAARKRLKNLSDAERAAWLKLDRLAAVHTLRDLGALQCNRLEILSDECGRQYAIRINEQWRIRFEWPDASRGPTAVALVDAGSGGQMAAVTIHPGEHLAEELGALNMSAAELARRIKVPTNRVTAILNGRRAVTGDTALRLAHFFGTTPQFWLNLQALFELRVAEAKAGKLIKTLPTMKRAERFAAAGQRDRGRGELTAR
jgi:antitoxin HigA-1